LSLFSCAATRASNGGAEATRESRRRSAKNMTLEAPCKVGQARGLTVVTTGRARDTSKRPAERRPLYNRCATVPSATRTCMYVFV
jgi:hypothetical protein